MIASDLSPYEATDDRRAADLDYRSRYAAVENECEHGRLAHDTTPECGCYTPTSSTPLGPALPTIDTIRARARARKEAEPYYPTPDEWEQLLAPVTTTTKEGSHHA